MALLQQPLTNSHHHLAPLGLASVDHSAAFKLWFLWFLLWQVILKNYIPSSLYTMLRGFGPYWKHGLADGGSVPVCATLVCFRGRGSRYSCQAHTAQLQPCFLRCLWASLYSLLWPPEGQKGFVQEGYSGISASISQSLQPIGWDPSIPRKTLALLKVHDIKYQSSP